MTLFHHSAEPIPSETYPPGQGDLIVLTSDNTSIGVHSIILKLASPVWQAPKDLRYREIETAFHCMNNAIAYDCSVIVPEDSETFECLLSFIYPDRMPLEFESLDIALSVLRAAVSYKMDRAIQEISRHLFDPSCRTSCVKYFMAADPLRVYAVAKELGLEQLAKRSGALTLITDAYVAPLSQEAHKMHTGTFMELLQMRRTRAHWLGDVLGERITFPVFPVEYQDHQRTHDQALEDPTVPLGFYMCSCPCPENEFDGDGQQRYLPCRLKARILDYPSPSVIEDIDFCKELGCLRCGAAANIFFGAVCRRYRETFQD